MFESRILNSKYVQFGNKSSSLLRVYQILKNGEEHHVVNINVLPDSEYVNDNGREITGELRVFIKSVIDKQKLCKDQFDELSNSHE